MYMMPISTVRCMRKVVQKTGDLCAALAAHYFGIVWLCEQAPPHVGVSNNPRTVYFPSESAHFLNEYPQQIFGQKWSYSWNAEVCTGHSVPRMPSAGPSLRSAALAARVSLFFRPLQPVGPKSTIGVWLRRCHPWIMVVSRRTDPLVLCLRLTAYVEQSWDIRNIWRRSEQPPCRCKVIYCVERGPDIEVSV